MRSESKVIAAVCRNKDIHKILETDTTEFFDSHADVWEWLYNYYSEHGAVPSTDLIEDNFPMVDLPNVTGETDYYINELRNDFIVNSINTILDQESSKELPGSDLLMSLQSRFSRLAKHTKVVRDVDITDYKDAVDTYKRRKRLSDEKGGSPGLPTGMRILDYGYATGLAPGQLIVVIGWSGYGKSLFSQLLACNIWNEGYHPMIVSLEMSPEEIRDRVYTIMGSGLFSNRGMARGDINIDSFEDWAESKFSDGNKFTIVSSEGMNQVTPQTVQGKIDQYKPDIVFLDYQQLFDHPDSSNEVVKNRNISRDFKTMAMRNKIPVVNLSQATQDSPSDLQDPPLIEQVAWSKGIQHDSDLALSVHKPPESDVMLVLARKNRHGPQFEFGIEWDIDSGVLEEIVPD